MNIEEELKQLLKARGDIEQRLDELDQKVNHLILTLQEERRCTSRKCALDELGLYWR
ncbi:MAG: hypothetical protein AMXMBFR84_51190 [Candidatus Hydrogenedentota bacterium]